MSKAREFADAATLNPIHLEGLIQEEVEEQIGAVDVIDSNNVTFEDEGVTELEATTVDGAIIEIVTTPIIGGTF